jgi:glycosyltransferase involved in cell wall biosynthesis
MRSHPTLFLYQGPHPVHKAWAESIGASFLYHNITVSIDRISEFNRFLRKAWHLCLRGALRIIPIVKHDIHCILSEGYSFTSPILKSRLKSRLVFLAADPFFYEVECLFNKLRTGSLSGLDKSRWRLYTDFLRSCDGVIAVSDMVKGDVEKFSRVLGKDIPVRVVYPFIDQVRFSKYRTSLKTNNIVFLGVHVLTKGIELLPEVFSYVKKEVRDAKLYILGRETRYIRMLRNFKHVDFKVVGYVENVEYFLRNATVLLHPALYDPFPVAVIEAMATGLIPVVTERTGSAEVVRKVSEGLIAKVEPKDIADKVVSILTLDYKARFELSEKCREVALSPIYSREYSVESFRRNYLNLIHEIEESSHTRE